MALDIGAKPIDVEYHSVKRDIFVPESPHDVASFFFAVVTEARGEITEGPAWRKRLPARDVGVIADKRRVRVPCDDDIRAAARHGFELQDVFLGVPDVEPATCRVVEHKHVLVRRHDDGQAVVHLLRLGRVSIARLVVERQAVAPAVHAEHALTAAEYFLAIFQREAKATRRFVGKVAVLLGDERLIIAIERHAHGRLVDDRLDAFYRERDARLRFFNRARAPARAGLGRQCERRELLYAVFEVMHLERRVIDRSNAKFAARADNDKRVAVTGMAAILAKISQRRAGRAQRDEQ